MDIEGWVQTPEAAQIANFIAAEVDGLVAEALDGHPIGSSARAVVEELRDKVLASFDDTAIGRALIAQDAAARERAKRTRDLMKGMPELLPPGSNKTWMHQTFERAFTQHLEAVRD